MDIEKLRNEIEEIDGQRYNLKHKLSSLESKKEELLNDIDYEKEEIKDIEESIVSLQQELQKNKKSLSDNNQKLPIVVEKISDMKEKLDVIDREFNEKIILFRKAEATELCQSSLTLNEENSYYVELTKTTSTTPIVTEYCNSNKKFMVLNAFMGLSYSTTFSYIIAKSEKRILEMHEDIPTMTELKMVSGKYITDVDTPRMQLLKNNIIKIFKKKENVSAGLIIPLSTPCLIGGQSAKDQSGYGWSWDWSWASGNPIEGTFYGEMSGFYVIGIIINQSPYYY